jgi:hypothetical protein
MWTLLGLAGRLASPLLAFVPGFNPRALMLAAGFLVLLVAIGGPAGAVWLHMRGEVKAAATAEKTVCELATAESEAVSARLLVDLLATIEAGEEDETETAAKACERDRFCKKTRGKP